MTLTDLAEGGSVDLAVATAFSADPQPAPPTPGLSASVVIDQVEGRLAGRIVRLTDEATPVYSDLDLEAVMSLTEVGAVGPLTDDDRSHGYKLVLRRVRRGSP